jgi:hypothetical protein
MANKIPAANRTLPRSSVSSSILSSRQCIPPPVSSPSACCVEWYVNKGNSLGLGRDPPPDVPSYSRPSSVNPARPTVSPSQPQHPSSPTTPMVESPPMTQAHSCSDCG